jgi:hypothetical protein
MSYREPLPEGCPPDAAEEIAAPREVFRLVRDSPPTMDDFRSQRGEKPGKVFSGVTECQASGLSVFTEKKDCVKLLKLAHLRSRKLCRVRLDAGAGRIQQTFQPSHHTWWPLATFDILSQAKVEAA